MSANRSRRRAFVRSARRDVKAWGCTCEPTITGANRERIKEVGAADGLLILHRRGCPVGDAAYRLNVIGIVPQDFVTSRRCGR